MWCRCVWAGDECEGVCGVGVYGLGMSAEVSVCVWAGDECGGVCVVGVYGLGLSAEVSECGVVCMGWG